MPISATTFRLLREAGVSPEALEAIVASIDDDMGFQPGGKTARQERNHRYYEKRKASELSRLNKASETSESKTPSRADTSLTKTSENNEGKKRKKEPISAEALVVVLSSVLDDPHSKALAEHRLTLAKAKRETFSEYAAKLLVDRLRSCPDPNVAADEMIVRGWASVKPNWLRDERPSTGPPRPQPSKNGLAAVVNRLHGRLNEPPPDPEPEPQHTGPTLDLRPTARAEPWIA